MTHSFIQKVSVIAPGWWSTGVNLKTRTHTAETAGQAKPVSVEATSSLKTGVFFEVVSLGQWANTIVSGGRFMTSPAHLCFPTADLTTLRCWQPARELINAHLKPTF